jgi:hypothetical protein
VVYSVTDPRIFQLLELAKNILTTSLGETQELLAELMTLEFTQRPAAGRRRRGTA